ncbi:hypothetical protein P691DRAFT_782865 [Macrolepiota fuliginosa MF-IS2]|uniref:Uncharacterized protein n=1 Tax=Macrolepiota fuliginosa MF-IS2 TaxID=1400762 RepID=A0A9P5WWQ7_9AGAR|nr:hypothetical protein P691DRAFT_782865 [Macrolepiota fuliginosa MF-IS2]
MPRKAKFKPVNNVPTLFQPSATTEQFLASMDQNCQITSQFTANEVTTIAGHNWEQVFMDLLKMNFMKVDDSALIADASIEVDTNEDAVYNEELSPAEDLTNSIAAFGQWFKSNNIPDSQCPGLINNIRCLAMMFSLIPAPHHCPIPLPCTCLHQADAPPCSHLHAEDIPAPPPCDHLHRDDEDTPMELPAPTCTFSEAASQTPAPSHEATTPPPPLAAAATLPAAVASIPPASPHGHASYASAAVKNLNPAAPPFVRGPPCAPVATPPAQAQQPTSSKCSKQPFFTTRGPSCQQFFIKVLSIPNSTSLPSLVKSANTALVHTKSTLWVDLAHFTPCSITHATVHIPTTANLNIIKASISSVLPGASISIPVSRSFIKIIDVPFFKPSTTKPLPSTEVGTQLQHSIIPSNYIVHWHFIQNSPKAEFATVPATINLWGVAEATPRPLPPSPPPLQTCLARMSTLASTVATNMPLMTIAALTGSTASTSPGSRIRPSGMPQPEKAFHLLPPQLHGASNNNALPPIDEEDKRDDDEMELFGLGLDNDYEFHK